MKLLLLNTPQSFVLASQPSVQLQFTVHSFLQLWLIPMNPRRKFNQLKQQYYIFQPPVNKLILLFYTDTHLLKSRDYRLALMH